MPDGGVFTGPGSTDKKWGLGKMTSGGSARQMRSTRAVSVVRSRQRGQRALQRFGPYSAFRNASANSSARKF